MTPDILVMFLILAAGPFDREKFEREQLPHDSDIHDIMESIAALPRPRLRECAGANSLNQRLAGSRGTQCGPDTVAPPVTRAVPGQPECQSVLPCWPGGARSVAAPPVGAMSHASRGTKRTRTAGKCPLEARTMSALRGAGIYKCARL